MSVHLTQLCQTNCFFSTWRASMMGYIKILQPNPRLLPNGKRARRMRKQRGKKSWSEVWCCILWYMGAGFPCPHSLSKPHLRAHCSVSSLMTFTIMLCFSKAPVTSPPGLIACSSPSTTSITALKQGHNLAHSLVPHTYPPPKLLCFQIPTDQVPVVSQEKLYKTISCQ